MSSAARAVLEEWTAPAWLSLAIAATGLLYVRGWFAIRKTRRERFDGRRLASFLAGLAVLWLAIGSPLDAFADVLLSAHMVEHLLLMSVVPPSILLGLPLVPLLRGMPGWCRDALAGPLLRRPQLRRLGRWLLLPWVAWLAMNLAFLAWHVPAAYDFALEHERWHELEHACFLASSLLFWQCILAPGPATGRRQDFSLLLYLVAADLVNTALSAFLAFCNRPIYSFYLRHPNPFQIEPLSDQILGAVIMWVFGSLAFLVPAVVITVHLLQSARPRLT